MFDDHSGAARGLSVLLRHRSSTRSAAVLGLSCSQTCTTSHPRTARASSLALSRRRLPSIFARHHSRLFFGSTPCSEQPCQKQPSTKTAIFARVNARSGCPGSWAWIRNRSPRPCSSRRRMSSGFVFCRGIRLICRETCSFLGVGRIRGVSDPFSRARKSLAARSESSVDISLERPAVRGPSGSLPFSGISCFANPSWSTPRQVPQPRLWQSRWIRPPAHGSPRSRWSCPAVAHGAAAGGEFRRSAQSF